MQQNRKERLSARVMGRVQGVYFRAFTRERARELGLTGWVKNEPDGTVRIEAEGPPEDLDRLLEAVRKGPPSARVEDVRAERGEPTDGFYGFEIRYR